MAYRDKEVGTATAATATDGGAADVPEPAPVAARSDWRLLYERTLKQAETAEARAEDLRWAEVVARTEAGSWKSRFEGSRRKRQEAVEEAKRARRAAKDALFLESEVARPTRLLRQAGVDPRKRTTMMSLRMEVERLRKAAPGAEIQAAEIHRLRKALGKENDDNVRLRLLLRDTVRQYEIADVGKERLKARLRRATETARSRSPAAADAELRKALRSSRRQKTVLNALTKENARLRRSLKASRQRVGTLEPQLAQLRSNRAALSKRLFGRGSEKQDMPRTGRRRGQQPGTPGHGRTPRPGLADRTEEHNPAAEARTCSGCGKPYVANGAEESGLVEIEVRAHRRAIRRPRWRRACDCAASPAEALAPPVPRLFDRTSYGTSVWSRFLYEHYACFRPLNRVSAWLSDQGLPVSAGTLGDSVPRFVPLFEPLGEAVRAHRNEAGLRHADETTWRVQALRESGRSARAWLWISVSDDAAYFHIDPSRSAEAAQKLFDGARLRTVVVCDRYSAYKKLARLHEGLLTLAWCWSHMRRDFIDSTRRRPRWRRRSTACSRRPNANSPACRTRRGRAARCARW